MVATGLGLGDVLDLALEGWRPRITQERGAVFGAAGRRGGEGDPEMIDLLRLSREEGDRDYPNPVYLTNPMDRMFGTRTGNRAARAVGNESRTLAALERLSVEIMAEALRATGVARNVERLLVMPRQQHEGPPVLMVMSPFIPDVGESRIISDELDIPVSVMQRVMFDAADPELETPEALAFRQVLMGGPVALAELFLISQPEIVLTRRPRMIPLCAPWPHVEVRAGEKTSTAGVLCRDEEGIFGVTACYHGTGPVGTTVLVGLRERCVKHVNKVQDIVFIPLDDGFNQPPLAGLSGVRKDREPARANYVRFDGATNQNRTTRIFGTDNGLLRARPTVQLKLQTDPDTDEGDSGCALIDDQDQVLGFAFERTDYNDYPQFTDWIWAANALRALGLTTV